MNKSFLSDNSLKHGMLTFSRELQKNDVEHFVFFGTLLGMCRSGKPIDGDDDVDFYVNRRHFGLVKKLIDSLGFDIDYKAFPNNSDCFIQVNGKMMGLPVRVDFYFYDAESDANYIIENWNFLGQPNNKDKVLKLPKPLIFPIKLSPCDGSLVAIPSHAEIICEFLYGINWRSRQEKGKDYQIAMIGGRPVRLTIQQGGATLMP